jgi:hypothetical protein
VTVCKYFGVFWVSPPPAGLNVVNHGSVELHVAHNPRKKHSGCHFAPPISEYLPFSSPIVGRGLDRAIALLSKPTSAPFPMKPSNLVGVGHVAANMELDTKLTTL